MESEGYSYITDVAAAMKLDLEPEGLHLGGWGAEGGEWDGILKPLLCFPLMQMKLAWKVFALGALFLASTGNRAVRRPRKWVYCPPCTLARWAGPEAASGLLIPAASELWDGKGQGSQQGL